MEPQARYVFVGISLIALSVLIVVALLWLTEASGRRDAHSYTIYFGKHALSGLQINSDVTMRGIKVGSVTNLHISERNIEQVRVDIVVEGDAPIKSDTVAVINRNFLTGFAMIDLAKGTQGAPRLERVDPGETHPVIPEGSSELEQIAETLPELFDQIGQVSGRIQTLLSEENLKHASGILQDVHEVTQTLAKNRDRFDVLLTQAERAASELSKVSHSVGEFTTPGGKLDRVSDELLAGLQEAREAATALNQGVSELLASVNGAAQIFTQQMLAVSQSISEGAHAATSTLQSYEEPRSLVGGPHPTALGPGESRTR